MGVKKIVTFTWSCGLYLCRRDGQGFRPGHGPFKDHSMEFYGPGDLGSLVYDLKICGLVFES